MIFCPELTHYLIWIFQFKFFLIFVDFLTQIADILILNAQYYNLMSKFYRVCTISWHEFLYFFTEIVSISDLCSNLVPNWSIFSPEFIHFLIWIGQFCSSTYKLFLTFAIFCPEIGRYFNQKWTILKFSIQILSYISRYFD